MRLTSVYKTVPHKKKSPPRTHHILWLNGPVHIWAFYAHDVTFFCCLLEKSLCLILGLRPKQSESSARLLPNIYSS